MRVEGTQPPNHHAHYPRFSGVTGFIAAMSMIGGRSGNAVLAGKLSGLREGDVVVDIGCGPGAAARYAARLGASVIGVDPAPVMLRVARTLTRSGQVRYVEGSAERLPLPDETACVAWTIASVHHWSDVAAGITEARRVLVADGRFVAIEKRREPAGRGLASHGWTDEQADAFAGLCRDHGFDSAQVETHEESGQPVLSVSAIAS